MAVGTDEQYRRFCGAVGLDALAVDPRFATNASRVTHYDTLRPLIADALRGRTRAEWIDALTAAGIPCGSVRDLGEVLTDPHLQARAMIEAVEHARAGSIRVMGVPIKMSDTPGSVRTAPPTLGQHTDPILRRELGFNDCDLEQLRRGEVI